jgi:hypothetical protein
MALREDLKVVVLIGGQGPPKQGFVKVARASTHAPIYCPGRSAGLIYQLLLEAHCLLPLFSVWRQEFQDLPATFSSLTTQRQADHGEITCKPGDYSEPDREVIRATVVPIQRLRVPRDRQIAESGGRILGRWNFNVTSLSLFRRAKPNISSKCRTGKMDGGAFAGPALWP